MFDNLSKKIGFTKTEIKIVLFISSVLILGYGYKKIFLDHKKTADKIIDYSGQNKLFNNYNFNNLNSDSAKSNDKKVDYKQEVLDFNRQSFNNIQKKIIPAEKSINLNTAKLSDFVKLPGIGEITAQSIIEYRKSVKKFNNVNELLNVKGIGNSKLKKIKKYIFVE
jgi:competence ComEA-like helix-hairpin-helix protein